jgi:hypothetical protein
VLGAYPAGTRIIVRCDRPHPRPPSPLAMLNRLGGWVALQLEPGPLMTSVRCLTLAKINSMGLDLP